MRITEKDLKATIKRFEDVTGIKTTLNQWHKHVYDKHNEKQEAQVAMMALSLDLGVQDDE